MLDYETIGILALNHYVAEVERFNARNARIQARKTHPCVLESEHHEPPCGINPEPSSISSHRQDWCDNCRYVQPYYLAYQAAAKKSRIARLKLTILIKQKMLSEGDE